MGPGGDAMAPYLADLHPSEHGELLSQAGVCERGEGGMIAMQAVTVCPEVSCAFFFFAVSSIIKIFLVQYTVFC